MKIQDIVTRTDMEKSHYDDPLDMQPPISRARVQQNIERVEEHVGGEVEVLNEYEMDGRQRMKIEVTYPPRVRGHEYDATALFRLRAEVSKIDIQGGFIDRLLGNERLVVEYTIVVEEKERDTE
jgi:hypothetical protein